MTDYSLPQTISDQDSGHITSSNNTPLEPSSSNCCTSLVRFPSINFPVVLFDHVPRLSSAALSELQKPPKYTDLENKLCLYRRKYKFRSALRPITERIPIDTYEPSDGRKDCFSSARFCKWNKSNPLCLAVLDNDIETMKYLLNSGWSPNCHDHHKRTPLHIAVSKGYCEMVQLLLDYGADANIKDGLDNSCLHLAACTNNVEMALILIKGGASVHAVDIRGRSPIQLAQSKLRILQQCPDGYVKSKVKQVIDMLLMYLQKKCEKITVGEETALLSSFQSRLQITESPEQISNEIDNLSNILNQMETSKILNQMETLTIK